MSVPLRKSGGKIQVEQLHLIKEFWFGGQCMFENDNEKCSCTFDLELAHAILTKLSKTKTNSRSSWERLTDTIDNPECFLLLCQTHHREFDGREKEEWAIYYYGDKI